MPVGGKLSLTGLRDDTPNHIGHHGAAGAEGAGGGLRVKMCVWLGVSRGLDLAFLNAD